MEEKLGRLWAEARELSLGTSGGVDRLESAPCPLRFLRDYVSANKPCLISRSATLHWPAISQSLWEDDAYLCRALRGRTVSVHLTPDGRADALALAPLPLPLPLPLPGPGPGPGSGSGSGGRQLCFASACVRPMPFPEALRLIIGSGSGSRSGVVAYAQQQNDCFRDEYSALADDVEPHIPWATEAIGCLPEAVNLWIGSARSETSFHKDHYENLYAVVTGEKHFLLLPPTDLHRLYVRPYPAARYTTATEGTGGELTLELELEEPERQVPWCSVDPYPHSSEAMEKQRSSFPLYFDGPRPFECTVKAGEILYLPSMWFHHVRQTPNRSGRTIAINYWYDMQFDIKYAYFNLLQSIEYPLDSDSSGKACKHGFDDSRSQISMSDSMHDVESENLEERIDSTNS